jgi:hypothetical protein
MTEAEQYAILRAQAAGFAEPEEWSLSNDRGALVSIPSLPLMFMLMPV